MQARLSGLTFSSSAEGGSSIRREESVRGQNVKEMSRMAPLPDAMSVRGGAADFL